MFQAPPINALSVFLGMDILINCICVYTMVVYMATEVFSSLQILKILKIYNQINKKAEKK